MRRPPFIPALFLAAAALGALPSVASAAASAWSPRSSAEPTQVWTRAGLVRVASARSEFPAARAARPRRTKAPIAASAIPTSSTRVAGLRVPERGPQSSLRAVAAPAATARLRTSALPDSGARAANLALLAGVFHEAHAPPLSLRSSRS